MLALIVIVFSYLVEKMLLRVDVILPVITQFPNPPLNTGVTTTDRKTISIVPDLRPQR